MAVGVWFGAASVGWRLLFEVGEEYNTKRSVWRVLGVHHEPSQVCLLLFDERDRGLFL